MEPSLENRDAARSRRTLSFPLLSSPFLSFSFVLQAEQKWKEGDDESRCVAINIELLFRADAGMVILKRKIRFGEDLKEWIT